jgi:hypothetical protein
MEGRHKQGKESRSETSLSQGAETWGKEAHDGVTVE